MNFQAFLISSLTISLSLPLMILSPGVSGNMAKSFLLERINSLSDFTAVLAVFHYLSCSSFLKGLPSPSLSMFALYEPSQASGATEYHG